MPSVLLGMAAMKAAGRARASPKPATVKKGRNLKAGRASGAKATRTQRELEDAILRRCAAGTDKLDRVRAPDVKIVSVKPGATGDAAFPRAWTRREDGKRHLRGTAEWYVPAGADTRRRMLFMHGGTYMLYSPQGAVYRSLCSRLARACGLCVLSIDFRLAPEHLFPAAYNDTVAALRWIASHGPDSTEIQEPATDVFVCGDSAGGGLAVAACVAPPAEVRRVLRGSVGLSPWLDLTASTPSYCTRVWDPDRCFGDAPSGPGYTREDGQQESEGYLGRGGCARHGRDWRASPFFAPAAKLKAMPAVLFHVGDYELIRDESVLLQKRMEELSHGDATVAVYPRMWHCWHEYAEGGGEGMPLQKAIRAMREVGKWVRARFAAKG